MCAIGGILWRNPEDSLPGDSAIRAMSAAMSHRGPDGEGFHHESRLRLLHRLLKIFNPKTEPGPYVSDNGRWVISYNGEIYNHEELRAKLAAKLPSAFGRLHSDAEILLEGWALEGPAFLDRVNGMFAFALWDRRNKSLTLGRDRLGEKPLYYYHDKEKFLFASEIKALKAAGVPMRLNKRALHDYLAYRYVAGPETLFEGIFKLTPGCLLTIGEDQLATVSSYWTLPKGQKIRDSREASQELAALLESSHQLRSSSSCIPAVFLSGGVDSATIASFLPRQSFAYTFRSPMTLDESEDAIQISGRFGLKHQSVHSEESMGAIVDQATWALEEPLADSIIIPTWCLAKAAGKATRVVLSGEGADEVFGGYIHHFLYQKLWQLRRILPTVSWSVGGWILGKTPPALLDRATLYPADLGPEARMRLIKIFAGLGEGKLNVSELTTLFPSRASGSHRRALEADIKNFRDLIQVDQQTWLPDYTLHRIDKILMNFGVEGRLPFLDHRIVELAASCRPGDFTRWNQRKWILRKAVEKRLGPQIAWRKKKPFLLDLSNDPGKELRERGLAASHALKARGLLEPDMDPTGSHSSGFLAAKRLFALDALETWIRTYGIEL